MTQATRVRSWIPGPAGGVTAAQWAALQAILASDTTGELTISVTDSSAVQIMKADGTVLANFNTNGMLLSVWNGAGFSGFSDAGSTETIRLRADNGHIITAGGAASAALSAGHTAGSGASVATPTGDDTSGRAVLTTGTGPGVGALFDVTFSQAYGAAPSMVLVGAANSSAGGLGLYVTNLATTGFQIGCKTAPPASTAMSIGWHVIG